jgi:hypothetical protein
MKVYTVIVLLGIFLWKQSVIVKADTIRIHTLGDSTMEQQDPNVKDQRGWPQLMPSFFTSEVIVLNHAKSGTSSKTFYKEGYWERAKKKITAGDYVFIQFGHNDEKHGGKDGKIGTAPTDSFRIYLSKYVEEVRELGAIPVLFTPVVRCMMGRDGKVSRRGMHDLGEYVHEREDATFNKNDTVTFNYGYNMRSLAKEMNCSCVDMTALTASLVNGLGKDSAVRLIFNLPSDGTHFGTSGALLFSQIAVKELKKQHILEKYIVESPRLIVTPDKLDWGNIYAGTSGSTVVDVCCLGEESEAGNINLSADGVCLATVNSNTLAECNGRQTLSVSYKIDHGIACRKVYASISPKSSGAISTDIAIKNGKDIVHISATGNCIALENNKEFSVSYRLQGNTKLQTRGIVIGQTEKWSGMVMEKYDQSNTIGMIDESNKYLRAKVQYNRIEGGTWPGNEIDVVYSRYIQFGVQSVEGSILHVEALDMFIGGGAKYRVVCSKDEDFAQAYTLGEYTAADARMRKQSWQVGQQLKSGEKLFIRIYPWCKDKTSDCWLCLSDIIIKGHSGLE